MGGKARVGLHHPGVEGACSVTVTAGCKLKCPAGVVVVVVVVVLVVVPAGS